MFILSDQNGYQSDNPSKHPTMILLLVANNYLCLSKNTVNSSLFIYKYLTYKYIYRKNGLV